MAGEVHARRGRRADKPGQLVAEDEVVVAAPRPPRSSRAAASSSRTRSRRSASTVAGRALPRRRRLDRRLHRLPAPARRRARDRARRGLRRAGLALRTDDRVTVLERVNARALTPDRAAVPARPGRRSTSRSSRCARSCRPCCAARPRSGSTAWPWSSRSSRSGATGSARAASCATWSSAARRCDGRAARRRARAPRCSASRPSGCPGPRATARRSSGWPRPAAGLGRRPRAGSGRGGA